MNKYFGDQHAYSDFYAYFGHVKIPNESITDTVMDRLRSILLLINGFLLFIIPALTWILTGETLKPIQREHEKEREFFSNASHDLRTPLTVLQGQIELSLRKDYSTQEYRQILQSNKEEVNDLILLTESMLFLSRSNEFFAKKMNEFVDLTDITLTTIHSLKHKALEKGLKLNFYPASQSLILSGNTLMIKRMLINIIDNAIKYTNKGNITVSLKKENKSALITVSDTGIGISQYEINKIFTRFYRSKFSNGEFGHGLGLSIVSQIVKYHHGTIKVSSVVEKGTNIYITIPLAINRGKNLS